MALKVPVGVSNRHVHLTQEDLEKLFGKDASLTVKKELSQPGQFAAEETVNLIGPKRAISNVRILGPVRPQTQVEISLTDSFTLGVEAPIRDSGNLANTPGLIIEGPKGRIEIKEGVIVAQRHLHLHDTEAAALGLKDQDNVQIKVDGPRGLIFDQVLVRVGPKYKKDLHLDTDEANAAGLKNGDLVTVIKP
ncbi:MAG: phosphate propanoyltransferase [Firmicutes bacterium]|nr:phosphate propanoyltransferase [Bacillota bacterium]